MLSAIWILLDERQDADLPCPAFGNVTVQSERVAS
jgi:hypothetical protein